MIYELVSVFAMPQWLIGWQQMKNETYKWGNISCSFLIWLITLLLLELEVLFS